MSDGKNRETDNSNRRKEAERHGAADGKMRETTVNKNLSKSDRTVMNWKDPHQKAMTSRENEAMKAFKENGKARREFGQAWGQEDHKRWMKERCDQETAKGRIKGKDFDVDVRMKHPDGKQVQLDYVDYEKNIIIDRKPQKSSDGPEKLAKKYADQRKRHIEAYKANRKINVAEYDYNISPSVADMGKAEKKGPGEGSSKTSGNSENTGK
jgi:hypothetical protein